MPIAETELSSNRISMTEAEAIEVLSDIAANAGTYFAIFISLNFGYLTVAYMVGSSFVTEIDRIISDSVEKRE